MFSLDRCRDIIGQHIEIDDVELTDLRDQLYGLAHIIADKIVNQNSGVQTLDDYTESDYRATTKLLTESEREDVEERAAIIEFEAGTKRGEAERRAVIAALQNRSAKKNQN